MLKRKFIFLSYLYAVFLYKISGNFHVIVTVGVVVAAFFNIEDKKNAAIPIGIFKHYSVLNLRNNTAAGTCVLGF